MDVLGNIDSMRAASRAARETRRTIGFVPTMGALHEGHLSLIRHCRDECSFCVVSIFVNPKQFGPEEDYEQYPRDEERDLEILRGEDVDAVFLPSVGEMYPSSDTMKVTVGRMGTILCGASRPEHFDGVATIVAKLFNIVQPDVAYFGQKDAQQVSIVRKLVNDLNYPVRISACHTVRENDGLAMSSRNRYLTPRERRAAPVLHRSLRLAQKLVNEGERDPTSIIQAAEDLIQMEPHAILEYAALVNPDTLEDAYDIEGGEILAVAAKIGETRLIDNTIIQIRDDSCEDSDWDEPEDDEDHLDDVVSEDHKSIDASPPRRGTRNIQFEDVLDEESE